MTEGEKKLGDEVSSLVDEMVLSEEEMAVLARVPEEDRVGVITRALREEKSLTEMTLREDLVEQGMSEEEINRRYQDGFINRGFNEASGGFEGLKTRKKDDPNLLRAMFRMLVKAGYAVRTDGDSIIPAPPGGLVDLRTKLQDGDGENRK